MCKNVCTFYNNKIRILWEIFKFFTCFYYTGLSEKSENDLIEIQSTAWTNLIPENGYTRSDWINLLLVEILFQEI